MSSHSPSPSPGVSRKARCCRTCGLPMKGHQRATCIPTGCPLLTPAQESALMPPPSTIPQDSSQLRTRLPGPDTRPIMPGAYANDRPSEISASSGSSPTRSLYERIGAKIEEESAVGIPRYPVDMQDQHFSRRASAPLQSYPTLVLGASASNYAASASGSIYGSSSTIVMPEHSASQRFIRHDRSGSDAGMPLQSRHVDRLGDFVHENAEFFGDDNDDFNEGASYEYDRSFDDDEEDEEDPAYPSDGSTVGGGASVESYNASESDAGTYSSSGLSSAPSFTALVRGSGASQLYTAYEVGAKYVPFLRERAKRKGYELRVLPGSPNEDDVDAKGRKVRSSREPGNVKIVLGRDVDTLKHISRQAELGASMMPGPSRPRQDRAHPSAEHMQAHYASPHLPPPPFPTSHSAPPPFSSPNSNISTQRQGSFLTSQFCQTLSAVLIGGALLIVVIILLLSRAPE